MTVGSKTHFTQQRQHTLSPSLYLGPYSTTGSRDIIVLLLKRSYQFEFYDATPRQRLDEFKALNLPCSTTMWTWIPHHYGTGGVWSALIHLFHPMSEINWHWFSGAFMTFMRAFPPSWQIVKMNQLIEIDTSVWIQVFHNIYIIYLSVVR